ncbi:MAG: NUDIX pyrophosphatase, partial [Candidatus Eisenbacteria bacterium]
PRPTTVPLVIEISCSQIEVHVFRRRGKRLEMLLLRRSPSRSLAGVWQPVTGGIERGESAMAAAVREVAEETGLTPLRWWALEQPASFYDVAADRIRVVPVFAAEVAWADPVHLSHEHDRYQFVSLSKASELVLWGTQRQAHRALAAEVLSGSSGGAAREITARQVVRAGAGAGAGAKPAKRGNTSRTRTKSPRPRAAAPRRAAPKRRAKPHSK